MIEGRLCLEVFMAKDVIQNITPDDISIMRTACNSAAIVQPSAELVFEEGMHGIYARISGNSFLEHLYQRVMALLNALYIQGLRVCNDEEWVREHRETHQQEELEIIAAIEAGNLADLENVVTLHVNNFGDFLLATLKKWPPKGLTWDLEE